MRCEVCLKKKMSFVKKRSNFKNIAMLDINVYFKASKSVYRKQRIYCPITTLYGGIKNYYLPQQIPHAIG
jgi:hypothetical protein